MKLATFNVLSQAYLDKPLRGYPGLKEVSREQRFSRLAEIISGLDFDILALQEVDEDLFSRLEAISELTSYYTPKQNKQEGIGLLVSESLAADSSYESSYYLDGSGHAYQLLCLNGLVIVNTHLKWSRADAEPHHGLAQAKELIELVAKFDRAVILADVNDRPGGIVRAEIEASGFVDALNGRPTALIDGQEVSIDAIYTQSLDVNRLDLGYEIEQSMPDIGFPSDHIPVAVLIK